MFWILILCLSAPLSLAENENFTRIIPSSDPNDISFLLYNDPLHPSYFRVITYGDSHSLLSSGFDPGRRTVILIHGFMANAFRDFPQDMKNTFLGANYSFNYILIDYGKLAGDPAESIAPAPYPLALNNVPIVGERLCDFILFIARVYNMSAVQGIHIIGHSLGAHVAGVTGRCLRAQDGLALDRISGLDPAGPLFWPPSTARNLMSTDARTVDVYHTNMGMQGIKSVDGTVDIFPNNGVLQPGCMIEDADVIGNQGIGMCSHRYAYRFYTASILRPFYGCQCIQLLQPSVLAMATCTGRPNDCPGSIQVGYHIPLDARGLYYLNTS